MYSAVRLQLLALVLLNHLHFIIALPTAATLHLPVSPTFNLSVSSASNNTTSLTSVNFHDTVAQGIAAAQSAYPHIVARLFDVGVTTSGGPESLPLAIESIYLALHVSYPKIIRTGFQARWGTWNSPVEENAPATFNRPNFDWDTVPFTFEAAQSKIYAAENVPGDRKEFDSVLMYVMTMNHPTLPIDEGELIYAFVNRDQQGGVSYVVWVVTRTREVFLEERPQATAPVQTT